MNDIALHQDFAAALASETDATVPGDHYDALRRTLVVRGFLRMCRVAFPPETQRQAERLLRGSLTAVVMHQMRPTEETSLEFEWLPADKSEQDDIPNYAALDAALLAKFGNCFPKEPNAAVKELLHYAYKRMYFWNPTTPHKRHLRASWLRRVEQLLSEEIDLCG